MTTPVRVGLISDTHDLLRPEAMAFLRGCDFIVHAGDIGERDILDQLATLAPVTAVRGNTDLEDWTLSLPESTSLQIGKVRLHVLHDLALLTLDPVGAGIDVVVTGHTHIPLVERRGAVHYVNPGSAGPRRYGLPVAIGELIVKGRMIVARTVVLAAAIRS